MNDLLERQLVEEAVLLAETTAAVEASKSTTAADEVYTCTCVYIVYIILTVVSSPVA